MDEMKELLPGIYQVDLHSNAHGVNEIKIYMIPGNPRSLMIDTGFRDLKCLEVLEQALSELEISPASLDIFLTHKHHDHCGLAYMFAEKGARIFQNPVEERHRYDCLHHSRGDSEEQDQVLRFVGITDELTPRLRQMFRELAKEGKDGDLLIETYPYAPALPEDVFRYGNYSFEAVPLSGHTLGQLGLYEKNKKLLFSGDQVINGVSPIVATSYKDERLLGRYFQSLNRLKEQYGDCTFIPAHSTVPVDNPIGAINRIVFAYLEKIQIMKQVVDHAREPMTIRQIASIAYGCQGLPESLDQLMKFKMILTKTFSCMEYLYEQDFAVRREEKGVLYWEAP